MTKNTAPSKSVYDLHLDIGHKLVETAATIQRTTEIQTQKLDIIKRMKSTADRRSVRLNLKQFGQTLYPTLTSVFADAISTHFETTSKSDIKIFGVFLDHVINSDLRKTKTQSTHNINTIHEDHWK